MIVVSALIQLGQWLCLMLGDADKVEIPLYNWEKTSLICSVKKGSLTMPGKSVIIFLGFSEKEYLVLRFWDISTFGQGLFFLCLFTYHFIHSRVWTD